MVWAPLSVYATPESVRSESETPPLCQPVQCWKQDRCALRWAQQPFRFPPWPTHPQLSVSNLTVLRKESLSRGSFTQHLAFQVKHLYKSARGELPTIEHAYPGVLATWGSIVCIFLGKYATFNSCPLIYSQALCIWRVYLQPCRTRKKKYQMATESRKFSFLM